MTRRNGRNDCSTSQPDTCTASDSMDNSMSFLSSSFVVVNNNNNNSRRRRAGSFGDDQPELSSTASLNNEWEFTANFQEIQDTNVVMMEKYDSYKKKERGLTAKDFMDGSDFMQTPNLFRDSHTSQRWHMDIMERPSQSFEEHVDDTDGMEDLFRRDLHLNEPEDNKNHSVPDCHNKADQATEPTTPVTERTTTPSSSVPSRERQEQKEHKKKHKKSKKKSKRRHSRLPSVVPPKEIDVSDSITVASSVGGLTHMVPQETKNIPSLLDKEQCLPRPPLDVMVSNAPARVVDVSASMTVASSIGQGSAWAKPKRSRRSPQEIDISGPMTVKSSLGAESVLRPMQQRKVSPLRNRRPLNLDRVHKSSLEIDVSDPTVVSSLGESMDPRRKYHPLPPSPQKYAYPTQEYKSLHHQLYSSDYR